MQKLDQTDKRLLKLLQQNARLTTKELAQKVNLSPTPVFERIKRLEKEGYIKKYIAVLDAEKLNNGFTIYCNIKLKQHSREIGNKFIQDIQAIDQVIECYNISGDFDFLLKVQVRDMPHYQDFVLNKLGEIDSIGSTQSVFVMGEIKNNHALPL